MNQTNNLTSKNEEKIEENKKSPSHKCLWWGIIIFVIVIIILLALNFLLRGMRSLYSGRYNNLNPTTANKQTELTKAELLDYFVDITTLKSELATPVRVAKWKKSEVTVSIEDEAPYFAPEVIDEFIEKFNKNSNSVQLKKVATGGDIKVYFQATTWGSAGRALPEIGTDNIINSGAARIDPKNGLTKLSLSSLVSHEMMHVLGMTGHHQTSVCRLMSPTTCGAQLTIDEERLIQMLYHTDLAESSNEEQIRSFLQNWSPE